jgi:hypothetical protein
MFKGGISGEQSRINTRCGRDSGGGNYEQPIRGRPLLASLESHLGLDSLARVMLRATWVLRSSTRQSRH